MCKRSESEGGMKPWLDKFGMLYTAQRIKLNRFHFKLAQIWSAQHAAQLENEHIYKSVLHTYTNVGY